MTTPRAETTAFLFMALVLNELLAHLKHGCPNRRLARLCYLALGHNCKLYVFCKHFIVIQKVRCTTYCETFSTRMAIQRIITDVILCSKHLDTPALIWGGLVFLFQTHQFVNPALYSPYSLPYFEFETTLTLSNFRICLFSLCGIRALQDFEFNSTVCQENSFQEQSK